MKLNRLEALRGFAAFYVVLHHSLPHSLKFSNWEIGYLFRFGQEAVILFFLLSGFVINYSYQTGGDKTPKTYFAKRAARIYIPLVLIMVLGYLLQCWRIGDFVDPQFTNLIANLFMLQDVKALKPNVIVEPYMGNTPLWSLSYEWWFYVLYFPIVKWVSNSVWRNRMVLVVTLLAASWYVTSPDFGSRLLTGC